MDNMITQDTLKAWLSYDPETGLFSWRKKTNRVKAGDTAGCLDAYGYVTIRVLKKLYKAHRLAWLYMTGEWPAHQVDHIDGSRSNNAWINLRQATNAENGQNRKISVKNTSGFNRVTYDKRYGKWYSVIRVGGKCKHLGYFGTPEEANEAYLTAKADVHEFQPVPRYIER